MVRLTPDATTPHTPPENEPKVACLSPEKSLPLDSRRIASSLAGLRSNLLPIWPRRRNEVSPVMYAPRTMLGEGERGGGAKLLETKEEKKKIYVF